MLYFSQIHTHIRKTPSLPETSLRDWKDCCLETLWSASVKGQEQVRPCPGEAVPCSTLPTLELYQPCCGCQFLAQGGNAPHSTSGAPNTAPKGPKWPEVPPAGRIQEGQGVFKVKRKAIRCLDPISSWKFYLNITGIQELVLICVLFCMSSVFLSFFLLIPTSWNFWELKTELA